MASAKPYVLEITPSAQDNAKLLQQLKSGFKRTISWNKYQSKTLEKFATGQGDDYTNGYQIILISKKIVS